MNTEIVNDGVEIYTHKLFSLVDKYIQERLGERKGKELRERECDRGG